MVYIEIFLCMSQEEQLFKGNPPSPPKKKGLAHLHPNSHICAKFHWNWSITEEVVCDARFAMDRPIDRQPIIPLTNLGKRGIKTKKNKKSQEL